MSRRKHDHPAVFAMAQCFDWLMFKYVSGLAVFDDEFPAHEVTMNPVHDFGAVYEA